MIFGSVALVVVGIFAQTIDGLTPNYIVLAIAGLILAVISIFGDLIASVIKRTYNIKDYGKLFPGHGGVLDRFDSNIAVAPTLVLVLTLAELFAMPFLA